MTTNIELRQQQRQWIEALEIKRDGIIDWLSVWGPVVCPLIPGSLTAAAIINVFPTLLHIYTWGAVLIAVVVVVGLEVLGIVSIETWLSMRQYNQALGEDEERAPSGWAGFVVTLYCIVLLMLVVFLKIWPDLALWSLVPLTLLGLITSWTVVLRKQHNERLFRRDAVRARELEEQNKSGIIADLQARLQQLAQAVQSHADEMERVNHEHAEQLADALDRQAEQLRGEHRVAMRELRVQLAEQRTEPRTVQTNTVNQIPAKAGSTDDTEQQKARLREIRLQERRGQIEQWNRTQLADEIGVSRTTLYKWLSEVDNELDSQVDTELPEPQTTVYTNGHH